MRSRLFYGVIALLLIWIPIGVMGVIGTSVSMKYEVDHGYIFTEINSTLSPFEKIVKMAEIEKLGKELSKQRIAYLVSIPVSVLLIIKLLAKRKKLLRTRSVGFPSQTD